jgi:dihydropteroate synthase
MQIGSLRLNAHRPVVMGILNTTPDSFSDGGNLFCDQQLDLGLALRRAEQMITEGAAIIDVGGESTRPGAKPVSIQQELDRVIPVVESLNRRFDVPVSLDTSSAQVMTEGAKTGAALINDVRALRREGAMLAAVNSGLPVCLMHMQGEPGSMQNRPDYVNVVAEVEHFLLERVAACVAAGVSVDRLILDPGFGFGKNLEHNVTLFRALPELVAKQFPVLVGVSRKAMVGALLGHKVDRLASDRAVGSVAMAMLAAQQGTAILRVHDVAETVDALKILSYLQ